MGHVRNYTIGDVLSRFKTLKGLMSFILWVGIHLECLQKMQLDRTNKIQKSWTESNIQTMKNQLKQLGLSIDWDREISTCSEDYYKHQQKFY